MRILIAAACVGLVLLSCGPKSMGPLPADLAAEADAWSARLAEKSGLAGAEREAFASALRDVGEHCADRYGRDGFRRLAAAATEPSNFITAFQQVSGTDIVDLYRDYMMWLDRSSKHNGGQWQTTGSDHFIFVYRKGSPAARDIEAIEIEAERALDQSCERFGFSRSNLRNTLESAVAAFDSASGLFYVHGGEYRSTGGKVVVALFDDHKEFLKFGHRRMTYGKATFGFSYSFTEGASCPMRIAVAYRSPFELISLTHEVVHAAHFASSTDVAAFRAMADSLMQAHPNGFSVTEEQVNRFMPPTSLGVIEGLATWGMLRFGLLARGGIEPDLGRMMAEVVRSGNWQGLPRAAGSGYELTFWDKTTAILGNRGPAMRKIKAMYVGMACCVDYLLETYGIEKLERMACMRVENTGPYIESIYGVSLADMERDWLASIGVQPR